MDHLVHQRAIPLRPVREQDHLQLLLVRRRLLRLLLHYIPMGLHLLPLTR